MCESVGVSETKVDMGLSGKVEDCVNVVSLQAVHDFRGVGDVAMVEGKVALVVESSSIVQRRTVVELVEGDDIVCIGIGQGQMSHQPASTAIISQVSFTVGAQKFLHESSPSCDHDVLDIWKRLEFCATFQDRCLLPYAEVFEELVGSIGGSWRFTISDQWELTALGFSGVEGGQNAQLTGRHSVDSIFGGHDERLLTRARECIEWLFGISLLKLRWWWAHRLRGGTLQKGGGQEASGAGTFLRAAQSTPTQPRSGFRTIEVQIRNPNFTTPEPQMLVE